jgi:hypothetical protein
MIDLLVRQHGMPAIDAYMLCMCMRRFAYQRDRRRAQLDRVVLLSARGVRLMSDPLFIIENDAAHAQAKALID